MKFATSSLLLALLCVACSSARAEEPPKAPRVIELVNGHDLGGWEARKYGRKQDWVLKDGALVCNWPLSVLVYRATPIPRDFELDFEWQSAKPENETISYTGRLGVLINDEGESRLSKTSGKRVRLARHEVGFPVANGQLTFSTELMPIVVETKDSTSYGRFLGDEVEATEKFGDGWNIGRIVWRKGIVQHWVNGEKIVEANLDEVKATWDEPGPMRAAMDQPLYISLKCDVSSKPEEVRFRKLSLRIVE